jgi:hypothetical protein
MLKGLDAETNWLAVNVQSQSNSNSDISSQSRESLQADSQLKVVETGSWGMWTVREPRGRWTSAVGSRYQATAVKTVIGNTILYVIVICEA